MRAPRRDRAPSPSAPCWERQTHTPSHNLSSNEPLLTRCYYYGSYTQFFSARARFCTQASTCGRGQVLRLLPSRERGIRRHPLTLENVQVLVLERMPELVWRHHSRRGLWSSFPRRHGPTKHSSSAMCSSRIDEEAPQMLDIYGYPLLWIGFEAPSHHRAAAAHIARAPGTCQGPFPLRNGSGVMML